MSIPRPEYPRPQFVRSNWLCLNGPWGFEIDPGDSGLDRGLLERDFRRSITVPFCPEAPLSGIGNVDFMNCVWYRRSVQVPAEWADHRILLHFQAVDYDATVWVNDTEVGRHRGGFTPFTCEITEVAQPGQTAAIVVRARDLRGQAKPGGKQSRAYANAGCLYTRTTGIWQTVWLEPVPEVHLRRPRATPDVANSRFRLELPLSSNPRGFAVRATLKDADGIVATATCPADVDLAPQLDLPIPEARRRLWSPADPHLYGLEIELLGHDGETVDRATSYAGLRSVALDGQAVRINGEPLFQRLVLDQGYYPDGIMTAPSDAALANDIKLAQAAGFNGARLHQKVFEERFLYHADRLGYLVWGEFGDWGIDRSDPKATCITQWLEVLQRDYSHPCIVGWCALNETAEVIGDTISGLDDLIRGLFLAAKAMDTSRPVLDSSGYSHRVPDVDVYDCHTYEQGVEQFAALHAGLAEGRPFVNTRDGRAISLPYRGQPFFVSEFGGVWWNPEASDGEYSWGYGDRPESIEEFYARFQGLCDALLGSPDMFGYCYTQLTDVYQEQNGIYYFDRRAKFDLERLHAIQQRPAAVETTPDAG